MSLDHGVAMDIQKSAAGSSQPLNNGVLGGRAKDSARNENEVAPEVWHRFGKCINRLQEMLSTRAPLLESSMQRPVPDGGKGDAENGLPPHMADVKLALIRIDDRLAQRDGIFVEVLELLAEIRSAQPKAKAVKRGWLTTAEFAAMAVEDGLRQHLTARTVQRWCREQRLKYREVSVRGKHGEYRISYDEYARFAEAGVLAKHPR